MRRRHSPENSKGGGFTTWVILFGIGSICCVLVYVLFSPLFFDSSIYGAQSLGSGSIAIGGQNSRDACCRGVEHLELWGRVVVWGDKHYANSSHDCCSACTALCKDDGVCECNSWVFCGDVDKCGSKFGQCWLKKQENPLAPDIQASGKQVMWTSGLIYGKDTGIVGIETKHGTIRIKLLVDCAPYSVAYVLELHKLRHCAGCHLYRAEGRGSSWNEEGEQIGQTISAPYGLVQGSLAVQTVAFKELPREACPGVQRGSVGWIEGGPDFFISLAKHDEWYPKQLFAHVLPEDMHIVEKLAALPTVSSIWSGVKVAVLEETIPIKIVNIEASQAAEVI